MFHSDPSSAHYLFDLERLKAKLKDAKIVKTAKSFLAIKLPQMVWFTLGKNLKCSSVVPLSPCCILKVEKPNINSKDEKMAKLFLRPANCHIYFKEDQNGPISPSITLY